MKKNNYDPGIAKFELRPASSQEAGLFYAMPSEQDAELGCIGHVRIDFGRNGDKFYHTWHPRGPEELNTHNFRDELTLVVDELRESVLKDFRSMRRYCRDHGGEISGGLIQNYGYIAETDHYRYCLRCNPLPGDYQAYLTCFDKRVQEMNMAENCKTACTFSNVRVSTDTDEMHLTVSGIPKDYEDLENYKKFEWFLQDIEEETEIQIQVESYTYGDQKEPINASSTELEYLIHCMETDKDFLSKRCAHIGSSDFSVTWSPEELFGLDTEDEGPRPLTIRSLAALKRAIQPGTELMATYHAKHPGIVGLVRVVTEVQTNAFYSVIKGQPDHKYSNCNYGQGFRSDFQKASDYQFEGTTIRVLDAMKRDGSVLCEFEVYEPEMKLEEQKEDKPTFTMTMGGI